MEKKRIEILKDEKKRQEIYTHRIKNHEYNFAGFFDSFVRTKPNQKKILFCFRISIELFVTFENKKTNCFDIVFLRQQIITL